MPLVGVAQSNRGEPVTAVWLLDTVQKKFCLKPSLVGEREGDRVHTAGDKQGKAELGSSKSLNLVTLHQAKIWPWQGTGGEDVTTL